MPWPILNGTAQLAEAVISHTGVIGCAGSIDLPHGHAHAPWRTAEPRKSQQSLEKASKRLDLTIFGACGGPRHRKNRARNLGQPRGQREIWRDCARARERECGSSRPSIVRSCSIEAPFVSQSKPKSRLPGCFVTTSRGRSRV